MQERYFSHTAAIATVLWLTVGALIAAGWGIVIFAPHRWLVAGMLAATGCALSPLAATLHVRIFQVRTCGLIRAASGLAPSPDADVRRLH
jgi:hypothetical protein